MIKIILLIIGTALTAKIVNINLNTSEINRNIEFKNTEMEKGIYTIYAEDRKGKKFYMKYGYPRAEIIKGKSISTYYENGKKRKKTKMINTYIYKLKCIKENDVYFNCIER